MQTCFHNITVTWCNTGYKLDLSKADYPKFNDVSKILLTVCASRDGGTTWQLQPLLFSFAYTYWWEYDNNGLRHTQLRFYPNTKANAVCTGTACTANAKQNAPQSLSTESGPDQYPDLKQRSRWHPSWM